MNRTPYRQIKIHVPARDRPLIEQAVEQAAANREQRVAPDSLSALMLTALEEYLRRCRRVDAEEAR